MSNEFSETPRKSGEEHFEKFCPTCGVKLGNSKHCANANCQAYHPYRNIERTIDYETLKRECQDRTEKDQ